MKILVTGAAGFIGSHLAARLLAEGREVTGVDNLNPYYDPRLKRARLGRLTAKPGFEFIRQIWPTAGERKRYSRAVPTMLWCTWRHKREFVIRSRTHMLIPSRM